MGGLREGVWLPLLSVFFGVSMGLRITNIEVPTTVRSGETIRLSCSFLLNPGDDLYSLTWWKDELVFYRFVPKSLEPQNVFSRPGIVVDKRNSTLQDVVMSVDHRASGQVKCEVISELPYFEQDSRATNMTVLDIPTRGPTITGEKKSYRVGELLLLNCSSPFSYPPSHLSWFINGKLASHETVVVYPREKTSLGCEASWSGLQMPLLSHHFQDGLLILRCAATILQEYGANTDVEIMDATYIPNPPLEGASTGGCGSLYNIQLLMAFLQISLLILLVT